MYSGGIPADINLGPDLHDLDSENDQLEEGLWMTAAADERSLLFDVCSVCNPGGHSRERGERIGWCLYGESGRDFRRPSLA
eukprot:1391968-Amorphochlora_amoeboformis.AAC.2